MRNQRFLRKYGVIQIFDIAFADRIGNPAFRRHYGAAFFPIEPGHIKTAFLSQRFQEIPAVFIAFAGSHFTVKRQKFNDGLFPFPDHHHIEKGCERFRIIDAGPAADDDGMTVIPLFRPKRNTGKIQYIQDIRHAQLILDAESQHIKITDGAVGFQRKQRRVFRP